MILYNAPYVLIVALMAIVLIKYALKPKKQKVKLKIIKNEKETKRKASDLHKM